MKTSKLKLRPFIPTMRDEEKDGREPYATLKYGNILIELDYTILRSLKLNIQGMDQVTALFASGIDEIQMEMNMDMGHEPYGHRDQNLPYMKSLTHYALHPINGPEVQRGEMCEHTPEGDRK